MLRPRIIPCLLVHKGGLVKTVQFKAPTYVGDPINAVKIFNEKETDELAVLDIDASVNQVEPDFRLIANLAAECRMPLCYGGGVKTADQARRIIGLGVEKVAISSAALERPALITEASGEIGTQSVVVILDTRLNPKSGKYEVWTHNGTRYTGRCLTELAQEVESLGAGEIVINAIDRDGTGIGYDLDLAKTLKRAIHIPITFLGGAGALQDIRLLVETCGIVGAAAGSLFVFKGPFRAVLINYPSPSHKDDLIIQALMTR